MQLNVEEVVRDRYTQGAREREGSLCCPTSYDGRFLAVLPAEIIERDYGCGDPSAYVREGDTVLDLGSGSGKICYIAAQIVGPAGHVVGVDMNDEMLGLARRHQPEIARRLGYDNVSFHRGKIQDLRTDWDAADAYLRHHPVASVGDFGDFERVLAEQRGTRPLVADDSVDVVVSNCVLNLVREQDKQMLFGEIFRVLRRGGRAVISDIVSDEVVPEALKQDPELWSGCIAGAFQESAFFDAFSAAGFHGIELLQRDEQPWRAVDGVEFRAVTVRAWKGKQGPCWDHNQAVIYRGPWSEVRDDDGHALRRGVPMAVCEKTFRLYTSEPYARDIVPILPRVPVVAEAAPPFDCHRDTMRHPRETKGLEYRATTEAAAVCCAPGQSCT
jgi:arsenite methyltransferase